MKNGVTLINWLRRHFILTYLLGGIVLLSFMGIVGTVASATHLPTDQGKQETSVVAPVTDTPTQTPEPTDAPTEPPTITVLPTRPQIIYSEPTDIYTLPTATPLPANPQSGGQQTTQQQQCAGATALCNDGTCSYSAHAQGTCSHHGGVAQWL